MEEKEKKSNEKNAKNIKKKTNINEEIKTKKTENIENKESKTEKNSNKNTKKVSKSKKPQIKEIDIKDIEKALIENKEIPKEEKNKINKKVVPNIIIGIILTVLNIFIIMGFKNIEGNNFIVDLKVFSGTFLAISIILFEKAYKMDDVNIAIYGIEMTVISIFNFALVYVYYTYYDNFKLVVFVSIILMILYYLIKSLIIYLKQKKIYLFEKSDITKIVKKEKRRNEDDS